MTEATHNLIGSPKQIAWAEDIRNSMIEALDEIERQTREKAPEATKNILLAIIENIRNQNTAEWWIEHRPDWDRDDNEETRKILSGAKIRELITDEFKARKAQ